MLYLIDAGVLITANNFYYPLDRVPEFWSWLIHIGVNEGAKIPIEMYEEISDGNDNLAEWIQLDETRESLLFDEVVNASLVARVSEEGYAPDLTDDEVEKIGRDPFIVAYALFDSVNRRVVTTEVSKPGRQRANRKLPDVCRDFGVISVNTFEFLRNLDFSTSWNA